MTITPSKLFQARYDILMDLTNRFKKEFEGKSQEELKDLLFDIEFAIKHEDVPLTLTLTAQITALQILID